MDLIRIIWVIYRGNNAGRFYQVNDQRWLSTNKEYDKN